MKQIQVKYERSITRVPVRVRSGLATTLAAGAVTLGALVMLALILTVVAFAMYYVVLSGVIETPMPVDSGQSYELNAPTLPIAHQNDEGNWVRLDPQPAGLNQ